MGASSSPLVACPMCLFLSGCSRPSGRCCFSLLFFRPSCPSVSILGRSGAVFWASCPFGQPWFPVLCSPCGVSHFAALSLVLSGRRDSCILVRWVLITLRWCSAVSLLFVSLLLVMVQPVLFLFAVSSSRSWGRCSQRLPPFRLLVPSRLAPPVPGGLAPSSCSIPPSRWGPALLFPVVPTQSVLPALSGALGGLPGSLLCLLPGSGSLSFHGSLWFWRGASASFHAGPTLGLSSAPWLFHRLLPPVPSVLPLLDSSLLCFLASWLVLVSAFQVLVESGPSSSAGVVSSVSSSCLRGSLGCLLLSTRGLPHVSVS